jgi:hypothetical protein
VRAGATVIGGSVIIIGAGAIVVDGSAIGVGAGVNVAAAIVMILYLGAVIASGC